MSDASDIEGVPTEADIDLIRRILPHRYPFLMIDRVRDIEPGRVATGIKLVTANEPHFQGHFPAARSCPACSSSRRWARPRACWWA